MNPLTSKLQLIKNHLASSKQTQHPVFSSLDFCFFDDLLTPEEVKFRKEVRDFTEKEISPVISDYYERAEFPQPILEKMGQKDWLRSLTKRPFGEEKSAMHFGLLLLEIARGDPSIGTIVFVHTGVILYTIEPYGSTEQKKLIPDMVKFKKYVGYGLTEPNIGSDAANVQTIAKKVEGGYIIQGSKRWQGNSNRDMVIIWAKNDETKKMDGFIVPITLPGVKVEVIDRKMSMRCVQNCHITLDNVFVPEESRLPNLKRGFGDISTGLAYSRLFAAWVAVGIAVGIYDNTIKYINSREQFGAKISSFQLTQEKLSRMMGYIQAMLLMLWRMTRLYENKRLTGGMSSMTKAWVTSRCREVARLGREMLGGNGIIADNYVMRAVLDIEGVHTYEGTYEINSLVAGREITGINAIKL